MPTVFIPPQMRDLADVESVEIEGTSIRQVIRALEDQFPGIRLRLCDGDAIAPGLAVSIDGSLSARGLLAPCKPDSEIHFLPGIGGG